MGLMEEFGKSLLSSIRPIVPIRPISPNPHFPELPGVRGAAKERAGQEQPVVVPQSSQTLQVPFCLTRMEPQFSHCSPV